MELKRLDVAHLGELGVELLDEIELMRSKCSRIQGRVSGRIKDCVANSLVIVRTLVERLGERGDMAYMKLQNTELEAQLRASRRENEERRREVASLNADIQALHAGRMPTPGIAVEPEPSRGSLEAVAVRGRRGKSKRELPLVSRRPGQGAHLRC